MQWTPIWVREEISVCCRILRFPSTDTTVQEQKNLLRACSANTYDKIVGDCSKVSDSLAAAKKKTDINQLDKSIDGYSRVVSKSKDILMTSSDNVDAIIQIQEKLNRSSDKLDKSLEEIVKNFN